MFFDSFVLKFERVKCETSLVHQMDFISAVIDGIGSLIEKMNQVVSNEKEADDLRLVLTRVCGILKEMSGKSFSGTTVAVLKSVLSTLSEVDDFIDEFKSKS